VVPGRPGHGDAGTGPSGDGPLARQHRRGRTLLRQGTYGGWVVGVGWGGGVGEPKGPRGRAPGAPRRGDEETRRRGDEETRRRDAPMARLSFLPRPTDTPNYLCPNSCRVKSCLATFSPIDLGIISADCPNHKLLSFFNNLTGRSERFAVGKVVPMVFHYPLISLE
jgi:hypothetical protein